MVKIAAFDYDGTLVDSFRGHPAIVALKTFFFRSLRPFFFLGEIVEVGTGSRWSMHAGAERFLNDAIARGLAVGIVTDRSLFSFVISARRAGLPIQFLRFVHARRSIFNRLIRHLVPGTVTILTTPHFKGDPGALRGFVGFCALLGAAPNEVLFIGDAECDRLAAAQCGFRFAHVDRTRPDFEAVRCALKGCLR